MPTRVSALTWDTEIQLIETILPPWALRVVKEHPDGFVTRADLFVTLYTFTPAEEGVSQPLRPVHTGQVFQLSEDREVIYTIDAEGDVLDGQ